MLFYNMSDMLPTWLPRLFSISGLEGFSLWPVGSGQSGQKTKREKRRHQGEGSKSPILQVSQFKCGECGNDASLYAGLGEHTVREYGWCNVDTVMMLFV